MPLFAENPSLPDADGRRFDYFFLESLRLKCNDRPGEAFRALRYALQIDSTSSAALYEVSSCYLLLKKENEALEALQKAVRYAPHNFEYKLAQAGLCRSLGKLREAVALYEDLIAVRPQDTDLYFHLTILYMQLNENEKAIEALNGLENNMGVNESVSIQKYRLYRTSEQNDLALQTLETLAAKFPTESKYRILIGDFFLENQDPEQARMHYERAKAMDADNPYYFIAMSKYFDAKGNPEASALEIEKALKNPTLDRDTKLGVLTRYIENLKADNRPNVNGLFEILMEQRPQDKELNRMFGHFLWLQGKTEEAKFQLQVATEALPEDLDAWSLLLEIVVREGDTSEIIRICNGALVYFPQTPEFHFYKGTALMLNREYAQALEAYREGADATPPENKGMLSTFAGQMADAQYQLGNRQEAFALYDKALQYNDHNIVALNNYAYYLSLQKEDLDKAERMAVSAVRMQSDNATYLDTYAWVLFQRENYSLARFYIESALAKSPHPSPEILEHAGDIFYKVGQIDRAVLHWEKALEQAQGENTELLEKKIADRMYYETLDARQ
jgi:tetratricopeptide (TPR) repeat protein